VSNLHEELTHSG